MRSGMRTSLSEQNVHMVAEEATMVVKNLIPSALVGKPSGRCGFCGPLLSGWSGGDHGRKSGRAAVAFWVRPGWGNSHRNSDGIWQLAGGAKQRSIGQADHRTAPGSRNEWRFTIMTITRVYTQYRAIKPMHLVFLTTVSPAGHGQCTCGRRQHPWIASSSQDPM